MTTSYNRRTKNGVPLLLLLNKFISIDLKRQIYLIVFWFGYVERDLINNLKERESIFLINSLFFSFFHLRVDSRKLGILCFTTSPDDSGAVLHFSLKPKMKFLLTLSLLVQTFKW